MRTARRLLRVLVVVFILLVGTGAAAAIVSQTQWFRNRVRVYVVAQASHYLNGAITVDRLGGNLYNGVELEGVAISIDGRPVVSARHIGLRYNFNQLITRALTIDEVRLDEPVVHVEQDGEGWTIAQLIKKPANEADRRGPASPIRIDTIDISNGTILVADGIDASGVRLPKRIERLDAKLAFAYEPVHYSIAVDHVSFRGSDPELALNSLSGEMAIRDDTLFLQSIAIRTAETSLSADGAIKQYLSSPVLELKITSDKTSVPELAKLVPALGGIELQPEFELGLNGPLDRLRVDMNARSSAGQLTCAFTADLASPGYAATGHVSVQHLDLAPLLNDRKQTSDINAAADIDLRSDSLPTVDSLAGTVKIDAPRLVAAGYAADHLTGTATVTGRRIDVAARGASYGATASAAGRIVLPAGREPLKLDLRGQARHVDVNALPRSLALPPVTSNLNADYHVVGAIETPTRSQTPKVAVDFDATLADSTIADAKIGAGSTVSVDTHAPELAYSANVTVRDADLQRLGEAFGVKALADERYRSRVEGHVELNGHGTTIQTLQAAAKGTIVDATLMNGHIANADFEAAVANNSAHLKAVGTFADVDPAAVSGEARFQGNLGGQFDLDATLNDVASGVTLDTVSGTAGLAINRSTVGGLGFDHATLDADYQNRSGEIRQLEVVGPDVNVSAHGTLALDDRGNSNLMFRADSPRLAEIGGLFDVPLTGIGSVDGTVTGNRSELQATGTLTGDGVTYQENGALTLTAQYSAKVPELDIKRAAVEADSKATFVKIAGQQIDEVSGTTKYADQRLDFNLTASQPKRSAKAGGTLLLHPDHQEVHLEQLALTTGNQQWSIPAGEPATVNYAHDLITIDKAHLVSGDQEIVAGGRFGPAGSSIQVTMNNVDLARVDEILLRPPQFTGRVNAKATIEGTRERPVVNGEFQVAGGGFKQFRYDSFGGTVRYESSGATIDAKLQQNADQWITAKGYLPAALFSTASANAEPATSVSGHVEATDADHIDLAVDSSPLGLGIIQGFTNEITDVQGTVEAHVRVTGAATDPHPAGAITIANGALTVASTGVAYSNIGGKVDLQPDRVHIDQITILDNHDSALSLTGDLAVHAREVGDFHLWITADDFKIIDNKLGNLRVQSALEVGGVLRSPELRGDFGVSSGRLDLDEIMAQLPSAYSTESIAAADTTANAPSANTAPPSRSLLDGLRMNVRITVPDDLLVNSAGIQVPGALVDLGALNVTLGGDLTATKDPSGTIRLTGAVNTVRGTYEFQGRRFEVLRDGSIRFEGTEDFDPRLDLRTHRLINGVDARVNIRGTLNKPEVALSSTPPLEDADILALVVFNQPLNELGTGQQMTLVQRAQDLATGAVTGTLSKSIAKALNLETFQFDIPAAGSGPSLTVGQQVGPNLYVKVQQGVGNVSNTNFLLEYAFTNWLRLQTNVQQGSETQQSLFQRNQGTGADLIFLFSK